MLLFTSFTRRILIGYCTGRINIETAFKENIARQYVARHGTKGNLLVKGTIVPSDIINNLEKPTTLVGVFIAAATNFNTDIDLLKQKLKSFIGKYVNVFPLALLTKSHPKSSWQGEFSTKTATTSIPRLSAFDSARYHQIHNLRGFKVSNF